MGSLSGKAKLVKELRAAGKSPLLVDAGNLLFAKDDSGDKEVALLTAHGLVRSYGKIGYEAVAVSPQDLKAGKDFFQTSRATGFPWISANVVDDEGQPVFPPAVIVKRPGAADVGIIGLTGKGENSSSWARMADWRATLPEHIARLKSSCGLLVLLSSLSDDENLEIADNYPEIAVIIASSPTTHGNQVPLVAGSSLITQSDGRGKYLGKLDLQWHPEGSWQTASPTDPLGRLRDRIASLDGQMQKYRQEESTKAPQYQARLKQMLAQKKSLEDRLKSLETTMKEQKSAFANTFDAAFLPVRPQASGDEVDKIVQDLKKSVAAYQKSRLRQNGQADRQADEVLQLANYTGVDSCGSCHERQAAFWAATAHARAYTTLVNSGQNYNPECLPCHVTGGSVSPGSSHAARNLLLVLPEDRQAVGCETCHGPGRRHALAPEHVRPTRKPAVKNCVTCHTPDHDDNFEYSTKMKVAGCPIE